MSARSALGAALLCVAGAVAGCGDAEEAVAPTPKVTVEMREDGYHPRRVRVPVGGRVTWVNVSSDAVTAQSPGVPEFVYDLRPLDAQNKFDTHTLQPGEAQSVEFDTPGRYVYFSSYDTTMTGSVEVTGER